MVYDPAEYFKSIAKNTIREEIRSYIGGANPMPDRMLYRCDVVTGDIAWAIRLHEDVEFSMDDGSVVSMKAGDAMLKPPSVDTITLMDRATFDNRYRKVDHGDVEHQESLGLFRHNDKQDDVYLAGLDGNMKAHLLGVAAHVADEIIRTPFRVAVAPAALLTRLIPDDDADNSLNHPAREYGVRFNGEDVKVVNGIDDNAILYRMGIDAVPEKAKAVVEACDTLREVIQRSSWEKESSRGKDKGPVRDHMTFTPLDVTILDGKDGIVASVAYKAEGIAGDRFNGEPPYKRDFTSLCAVVSAKPDGSDVKVSFERDEHSRESAYRHAVRERSAAEVANAVIDWQQRRADSDVTAKDGYRFGAWSEHLAKQRAKDAEDNTVADPRQQRRAGGEVTAKAESPYSVWIKQHRAGLDAAEKNDGPEQKL